MTGPLTESRRRAWALPALVVAACLGGAGGCRLDAVATPNCVTDDECGTGNACTAGTCIPQGVAQGGTWAIDLVPGNDSSAATTRLPAVTFSADFTVLSAEAKQTVTGSLAPGASLAGASHMVALLQTAIPGYTDLKIETDSSVQTGASDASFTFKVPTGALGRMATFHLIPLPPRDVAQPPVNVTARLAPTVNLSYSSNYYFVTGRLISPTQDPQPNYTVRAFEGGQLVSSVDTTNPAGGFRLAIPVDAAYAITGQLLTVELVSGSSDSGALRFTTPPIMLTTHHDLGDLTLPVVPGTATYRFSVADPTRQPIAGALVRVHTDVSFNGSGAFDFTRDGVTDAAGNVQMMLLTGSSGAPRSYDIAVAAPPTSRFGSTCINGFQITDQTPTAAASNAIATSLSVPQKATLPGTIVSAAGDAVAAVSVAATRTGPDPTASCGKADLPSSVASATSGRDGSFQLMLDPGTYVLDYDPPAGAPVPRLTEPSVTVAAGGNGSHAVQLLPGALLKGAVRDAAGVPLPFAGVRFLEVACEGQDACFGMNRVKPIVRGDTHSDADGMFRVVVPILSP